MRRTFATSAPKNQKYPPTEKQKCTELLALPVAILCSKTISVTPADRSVNATVHGLHHAANFDEVAETPDQAKPLTAWCKRITKHHQYAAR